MDTPNQSMAGYLEIGMEWMRKHPKEAVIAGTVGGLIIGFAGMGRVMTGVATLRSMPLVSQFLVGALLKKNSDAHPTH